jgi:hypothetical protein
VATMPKSYTGQLIYALYNSTSFGHVDLNRDEVKQVQKSLQEVECTIYYILIDFTPKMASHPSVAVMH